MKKTILLVAIIVLSACSTSKTTAENSLMKIWGPPVSVIQDTENGNEILIYGDQIYTEKNDSGSSIAGPAVWDYVYFYANKDGKIYSSKSEKNQLRPQQIAVK